jgi:hypothetical protein
LRPSSPSRRRLPIDRTAQFYLPFLVESAVPNPALETDLQSETLSGQPGRKFIGDVE